MRTRPYRNVVIEYRCKLTHRADESHSILDKIIAATAKLSILEIRKEYEDPGKRIDSIYDAIWMIKDSDDELLNHIINLQIQGKKEIAEMEQRENNRLISIACQYEDCIYIEVSNVRSGSLLAYHLGDFKGVVWPILHSGMFQDSVLYMKYDREDDPCSFDFRYFPKGWEDIMKTYYWSDNIIRAVIKNETGHILRFNHVDIPTGETMIFYSNGHQQGEKS